MLSKNILTICLVLLAAAAGCKPHQNTDSESLATPNSRKTDGIGKEDLTNLVIDAAFTTDTGKLLIKIGNNSFEPNTVGPKVPDWITYGTFFGDSSGLVLLDSRGLASQGDSKSGEFTETFTDPKAKDGQVEVHVKNGNGSIEDSGSKVATLRLLPTDKTSTLLSDLKSGKITLVLSELVRHNSSLKTR
jgi:hypothetical protein